MTPDTPMTPSLIRVSDIVARLHAIEREKLSLERELRDLKLIVARLHAIEREKLSLERELRDLKLTESKTLLTES